MLSRGVQRGYLLILLHCVTAQLSQQDLGDQQEETARVQQVLRIDSLWSGESADVPPLVRDQFVSLKHQLLESLIPPVSPISAVQACHATGKEYFITISCAGLDGTETMAHSDELAGLLITGNSSAHPALYFEVKPTPVEASRLLSAELNVFVLPSQLTTRHNDFFMMRVYQVVGGQPLSQPDSHRLLNVHYPHSLPPPAGQWLSFNVMPAVREWLTGSRANLGLLVTEVEHFLTGPRAPLLLLKYSAHASVVPVPFEIRGWHNASSLDEQLKPQPCARHVWQLDLSQWGLLAPQEVDVGMCSGSCYPSSLDPHAAAHTTLLSILGSQRNLTPYCIASDYRSSPVMYRQQNGNFIIKVIPNLVANACTCK